MRPRAHPTQVSSVPLPAIILLIVALSVAMLPTIGLAAAASPDQTPDPAQGPFARPAQVRVEDYFPPVAAGAEFDASVPRPDSVLGHEVGSRLARHDLVVAWFEALAAGSPRVNLVDLGVTHEGRRQITAIISSVRNIDRLREIQRAHLAGEPDAPIFTWHGYSIHGNEASGVQAAMAVAWYLAAGRDDEVRDLLRDTVVMIDPALNPDGYGRFSNWANQSAGRIPVGDVLHRERTEAWPGGRGNHYLFDLNRDWLQLQQPESVNRVALLRKYQPHIMTDHHEMGGDSTFFFQPGVESRWHPMIPEANRALTERLGGYHARSLDGAQRLYYSGESFDDFYPGKGSTWPDLQGTVGILFEQASTRGVVRDTRQGRITLPMAVHNHVLATLSSLEGARDLGDELRSFRMEYKERRHLPGGVGSGGWIFDDGGDPSRAAALVELITNQDLTIFGITEPVRAGGRDYLPGRAWVVPALGERAALVETLFAKQTEFEDQTFYDVSAWSVPSAFGVNASRVSRVPTRLDTESRVNRNYSVTGRTEPVAWVLPWDDYFAPTVLQRLQKAGVRARVALEGFESSSSSQPVRFKAGSVVIHESDVPDMEERKRDFLARIAAGDAPLVGLDSSLSRQGPDLGSPRMKPLEPASVALVAGEGSNRASVGSIWHTLDFRLGMPVTLLRPDYIGTAALERHTHLFMADGDYQNIPEETVEVIGRWVEQGGVLVVLRRAAQWAQTLDWLPDPAEQNQPRERHAYGEMADRDGAQQVGGAIVDVILDQSHPLTFGINAGSIGLMKRGRIALKAPWNNPFTVVGAYSDDPLRSGYLPDGYPAEIAGQPAILAVPKGAGVVIAFADAPAFRSVWWVGQRLLSNAVSFGAVIQAPRGTYGGSKQEKPRD